ncbi:hypothetical protein [Methylotuvimicrobium sp.]|uniref:hypothetical protein n=1 Tax=Methylotuvimicrobium sp. TaxID=2822413 RepID=UPI003D64F757
MSRQIGRPATLDDILDSELNELANLGFDWIYYTFRTSNFGNTRGGVGVFDKGFASMELA